ncbi:phage/plasmid primase, P4 family [Agrococcus sp. Ld7]|uniref:phage/plasmid primase, P4 family n=1 Tax=Agrococcus sp. Ld7 TaxID=649148 RepID=UPI00386CAA1C
MIQRKDRKARSHPPVEKRSFSAEQVAEALGSRFFGERSGDEQKLYCPVCENPATSKSASASVNLAELRWWCHTRGEEPDHRISLDGVVRQLTSFDADPVGHSDAPSVRPAARLQPIEDQGDPGRWHEQLIHGFPKFLPYLHNQRGLTPDTIARYKIGFDGLAYTLPIHVPALGYTNVRRYNPQPKPGFPKIWSAEGHGQAALAYTANLVGNTLPVLLTEGELDCLLAHQERRGVDGVELYVGIATTGGAGNRAVNPEAVAGRQVHIAFDNDDAGRAGAQRMKAALREIGAEVYILDVRDLGIPDGANGQDVTDAFMRYGCTAERVAEAMSKARARTEAVKQEPPEFMHTDLGNAERLAAVFGQDMRWVADQSRWVVWREGRWVDDHHGQVIAWAKASARMIWHEDPKWAKASESRARIESAVKLAQSDSALSVLADEFDADPWLLNLKNGTVDLRTGELREHRREDFIRRIVPHDFDPNATAPTFEAFLNKVQPDPEMRAFLQRAVGYSLTGHTSEQKMLLLHGNGQTGKSTFVETLMRLLGPYAKSLPSASLVAQGFDRIPADIAMLHGARFVSVSEFEDGRQINERLVKQLTGGDTMTARFMRENFFEFRPQCTIWVTTNHKPQVRGTDEGIWRRLLLVTFGVRIPDSERDDSLAERLAEELSGILRWAVDGAEEWARVGLQPPPGVLAETRVYRSEADLMLSFLEEACEVGPHASVSKQHLYDGYREWCDTSGLRAVSKNVFGRMLKERTDLIDVLGEERRGKNKVYFWTGIGLLSHLASVDELGGSNGPRVVGRAAIRAATRRTLSSTEDKP